MSGLWERLKGARMIRVIVVYLAASWIVLQVTDVLRDSLKLPDWVSPVALLLLLAGFVVVLATAWVQSHPMTPHREAAGEVPASHALDLGGLKDAVARGQLPHLTWGRTALGGVFAFSLLFGIAGLYVVIKDRGQSFAPADAVAEATAAPGIAVLPFSVRGEGLEVWREGMVDLLATGLDGAAGLRAIDSRTVLARWGEHVQGDADADLATALEVARQTAARYAILGSAVATGPELRFVADVYEVESGRSIGQARAEGSADSVLALADRLAVEVLKVILERGEEDLPRVNLAHVTTSSFPALKAYLEGEVLMRRSDFDAAIEAYRRAVEADSTFALAWYRMSDAYGWSESIASAQGLEAIERAARLADRLPEREAILVRANLALLRFTKDGVEPLRDAVRRFPDDADAWYLLADTYYHQRSTLATPEEVDRAFARAVEIDPRFTPYQLHRIHLAIGTFADSARAAELVATYGRLASGTRWDRTNRAGFALAFGSAASWRSVLDTLDPEIVYSLQEYLPPRFVAQREAVLLEAIESGDEEVRTRATGRLIGTLIGSGRLKRAFEVAEGPSADPGQRLCLPYNALRRGLPVPPDRVERTLAVPVDSTNRNGTFCLGLLAADRGAWPIHAAAVAQLRRQSTEDLAAGDSLAAQRMGALAMALAAHATWKRGDPAGALEPMLSALREVDQPQVTWLLGELYLELDRPLDAERVFASFWYDPVAHVRLARILEERGETADAREHYEFAVEAWREADPEMRAIVEEARQGLIRTRGLQRG